VRSRSRCSGQRRRRGSRPPGAVLVHLVHIAKGGAGLIPIVVDKLKERSRTRLLAAASGLCLAVAGISALGAEHPFDGLYSGKRVLTKGSAGPLCPADDDVSITIHGETLLFTNSAARNFGVGFYPRQDGSFHQTYTSEGGAVVDIRGRVTEDVIEADVKNPPCEYHWSLQKTA